jgi:hypothetical protein
MSQLMLGHDSEQQQQPLVKIMSLHSPDIHVIAGTRAHRGHHILLQGIDGRMRVSQQLPHARHNMLRLDCVVAGQAAILQRAYVCEACKSAHTSCDPAKGPLPSAFPVIALWLHHVQSAQHRRSASNITSCE